MKTAVLFAAAGFSIHGFADAFGHFLVPLFFRMWGMA